MLSMENVELDGRRVLIREDLNVPIRDGVVTSDARIRAALPTIKTALSSNAAVMLMSHLGRPVEGEYDEALSLQPVANQLEMLLDRKVRLVKDWVDGVEVAPGEVVLLENVRFLVGEKADDDALAKKMAALCDVFVMDAFGTAHRAQASTHGVAKYAPCACAGPLLSAELDALNRALHQPQRPVVAIVGGSKVSTKLTVLEALADVVDQLIVGGGIANTFIAAEGHGVGESLHEPKLLDIARRLSAQAHVPVPTDVVVAECFAEDADATVRAVDAVADNELILDVGPRTAAEFAELLSQAGTIIWNGPVGVFEMPAFETGTKSLAQEVAKATARGAITVIGGGDTATAALKFGIDQQVYHLSTGGGASLELLEGKTLPGLAALSTN